MSRDVTLLRRFSDPENSSDPDVVELVNRLRGLEYAPAPRPQFRDDLRAQLVAIAPRVVAEGEPVTAPLRAARTATPVSASPTSVTPISVNRAVEKRARLGRPLRLAAASVAILSLGLGGAVWKSQSALPGDSLYGLKRASENVRLSLTSGDTARGNEYLSLASTRVEEAHALLGSDSAMASGSGVLASGISPQTAQLVRTTLSAANTDLTSGSTLLGTEAVRTHSAAPLKIMQTWAPQQLHRLAQLSSEIGAGPLRTSTQQSRTLVASALTRARTLEPRVVKGCDAAPADRLGPFCTATPTRVTPGIGTPTTPANNHPGVTGTGTGTKHPTGPGRTTHTTPSTGPGTRPPGSKTPSGHRTHHSHGSPTPTPILPTVPPILPSGKPTLPITINSCGISAQVGPIGIALGSCPKSK